MPKEMVAKEKSTRGNATQFFIAGQLCRMGYSAVVTLGNTPNTDILCSNVEGTDFIHIQVKTFVPGIKTCSVGKRAGHNYGEKFFGILGGIPKWGSSDPFEYYIIPSPVMAENVTAYHKSWLEKAGSDGRPHQDSNFRIVSIPPSKSEIAWSVEGYKDRWDLIEEKLGGGHQ